MKKIALACVFLSSFALTGCLEELLASLCKRLASNDSIITVYESSNPEDYNNLFAEITYKKTNEDGEDSYTVSECDNDFEFPNGYKKIVTEGGISGISFSSVLDEEGQTFFSSDESVLDETSQFTSTVKWYSSSDCAVANEVHLPARESVSDTLDWVMAIEDDLIPDELKVIEECQITGQAAMVYILE